ncbi:hypothetical protein SLINC_4538 [Streptomyces lincolnensis]|uniref:Uncharacterized protein n=1 Tax=Streptomyces lincolnensis TaxID=1915 RepID=A0A1B1MEE3_STRLN|nr:hypothetical protein SLINC_4538 [Streptomyces lincolnensis]AXG55633.1 hypothetical protein SLCG_4478 [Streptomyces lincolnensis]
MGVGVLCLQDVAVSKKSEPFVVMMTLDRETSSVVLTRSDGKEARQPMGQSPFESTSLLSRLHYSPALGGLLAVTCKGDDIAFELPARDLDQLERRLVVYLDQNMWRPVSEALQGGATVESKDRDAADQLAEWVRDRRIVLPASAGHYHETTKWSLADKRYRLGLTILQLSRGWQMRDPLQVRRDEIGGMFRGWLGQGDDVRAASVFTLAPNSLHSASRLTSYSPPSDFSVADAFRMVSLTSASAYIDVMLDTERVEPGPEPGWVQSNQQFSDWLDGQNWDSQQKRRSIDAFLFADLQRDLAEGAHAAGLSPQDLQQWGQKQPMDGLSTLPATGLYREMLHNRHLNKGTTWQRNDLTDMIYLSCAAGYADFVVCERHMREPLERGVRRLGLRTKVFRRLSEAVVAVGQALEQQAHDTSASTKKES